MTRALLIALVAGASIVSLHPLLAQNAARAQGPANRQEMNAWLAGLIQARLASEQSLRLSADTVALTGNTVRLSGHAMVRFDDSMIRADEVTLNPATKQVELVGAVRAFLGRAAGRVMPPVQQPQYR